MSKRLPKIPDSLDPQIHAALERIPTGITCPTHGDHELESVDVEVVAPTSAGYVPVARSTYDREQCGNRVGWSRAYAAGYDGIDWSN